MKITMRAARVNAGLKQWQAAALIGVSPLTISDWERKQYKPDPSRHKAIARAYGLNTDQIIWED